MLRVTWPLVRMASALLSLAVVLGPSGFFEQVLAQAGTYVQTFDGTPSHPTPWTPVDWDITVLGTTATTIQPMDAEHGSDCSPPPATHPVIRIEDTVFICVNHLMTAMNNGYGAIYLTPNQLLDFSQGEAVLKWDMSTQRTSSRDWVDIVLMPFTEAHQVTFQDVHVPRDAIHLELAGGNGVFVPSVWRDYVSQRLSADTFHTWDMIFANFGLTASAVRRDTFELHLSRSHIKFMLPAYNVTWIDTDISPPLTWSQAVIQLNQRSYNPDKACNFDGTCGPNTWHWDNVTVAPAAPFTVLRGDRRYVDQTTTAQVNFPAPAPANAYLRFTGGGKPIEFSVNNGATWTTATVQGIEAPASNPAMGDGFWSPVPAGTRSVLFRGQNHGTVLWGVQDISVWAPGPAVQLPTSTPVAGGPTSTPVATPTTATRSSSQSPTSTPIPTATPTPLVLSGSTPTPTSTTAPVSSSGSGGSPSNSTSGGGTSSSGGGGGNTSRSSQQPAPAAFSSGGGGGGGGATFLPPLAGAPAATQAPIELSQGEPALLALPQVTTPMDIPAGGGVVAVDEMALTVSVPADALGETPVHVSAVRRAVDSLPSPANGLTLGSTAFDLVLAPAGGAPPLETLPSPIELGYLPNAADLAGGSQLRLAIWTSAATWAPLPCNVESDGRLTCLTTRAGLFALVVASPRAGPLEEDVTGGRIYREANGFGGAGSAGFEVVDDSDAPLWSEFQRLGGIDALGYPISSRFAYDGLLTQAFQKGVLQWSPDQGQAALLDVLDVLSQRGYDSWLERARQVPPAGAAAPSEVTATGDDVGSEGPGLLDAYPALRDAYESTPDATDRYGLPISVADFGPVVTLRLQRATLQLWKLDAPWATAGTVTVGNAGDLGREVGLWPMAALTPVMATSAGISE